MFSISDIVNIRWHQRNLNRQEPLVRVDEIDYADIRRGLKSQRMLSVKTAESDLKKRKIRKGKCWSKLISMEELRSILKYGS